MTNRFVYWAYSICFLMLLSCQSQKDHASTERKPEDVFLNALKKLGENKYEEFLSDVVDTDVNHVGKDKMKTMLQQKMDGFKNVANKILIDSIERVNDEHLTIHYVMVTNDSDSVFYQQNMTKFSNQWKLKLM